MMSALSPIPLHVMALAKALHKKTAENGPFNRSITDGEGHLQGTIGEVLVKEFLAASGVPAQIVGDFDFDILAGKIRLEVKTQRQQGPRIRPDYEVNVQDRLSMGLPQQDCDAYVFCRVDNDCEYGGVIGWALSEDVYHSGRWMLRKKGSILGSKQHAKNDCWCLLFSRLAQPNTLADYILTESKKKLRNR
jgi:hypothetical protein